MRSMQYVSDRRCQLRTNQGKSRRQCDKKIRNYGCSDYVPMVYGLKTTTYQPSRPHTIADKQHTYCRHNTTVFPKPQIVKED